MTAIVPKRVIKKVMAAHGHHGGAWKVAYADFVTAMMALFMVLWLLASTDAQTRKEISNYFRTGVLPDGSLAMNRAAQLQPSLMEMASEVPPPGQESFDERDATASSVKEQLAIMASIDAELAGVVTSIHVEVTPDGVLIEAVDQGTGLLFDVASSRLNAPLQHFIQVMAPIIAKIGKPIEIQGHTDARPFLPGSKLSNWDLSYQRASAAREILITNGIDDHMVLGVYAMGSSKLYLKNEPLAPQNRRLSILIKIAKPADTKMATKAN